MIDNKKDVNVPTGNTMKKSFAKREDMVGYVKGVKNLNIRSKPDPNSDIIATVVMGTALTVKGSADEHYYHVVTPDLKDGYALKDFVEIRR